ncbi:zinc-binding alcohol dehydrogenase family protein [Pelosinus propionicus]|uniref:2-desacetyl-2-hydroxyethyl bacteriochlorophyllide A dehydrogenase n=1 Tax=Pelosinus propionicus DSM 13327 TaxID=1123291 RepID=A0A1I4I4T6_9FIRM|nr:zinc-binding alcohol dehydrogenase family protein [Pelosinus propionicus]SFL49180.1 2-desacetyl-2-hydroxyethyl bacteriochlorophyllide A dehydrogenase [Pelosinus propionicus DSM 13327]
MRRMKAIYLQSPGDIKVEEVAYPQRGENEVLIKTRSLGICGSDIGAYMGTNPLVSYPRIIGHEAAGEVVAVPEGETELAIGDHVVIEPYVYCGECYPCQNDRTNCCENLTVRGVHIDGAMSEYFVHPRNLVHKVPKEIPWNLLAMVEPLTISMHAVKRSRVKAGEYVAITGSGPIGLLAAQYALTLNAIPIVVDPVEERLEFAKQLGVKYTVNPVKVDAINEIKTITNGRMAEVIIEASGNAAAVRSSIDYVSYAGRISLVGWPKSEISLPTALFTKKELDIVGSRNSFHAFPESVKLVGEHKVDVAAVITKTISFEDVPALVSDIAAHPGNYLKVVALL